MTKRPEPDRVQVLITISHRPGSTYDVTITSREGLEPFEGALRGSMSPTRFTYWVRDLAPDQIHDRLERVVLQMWGGELAQSRIDVDALLHGT